MFGQQSSLKFFKHADNGWTFISTLFYEYFYEYYTLVCQIYKRKFQFLRNIQTLFKISFLLRLPGSVSVESGETC